MLLAFVSTFAAPNFPHVNYFYGRASLATTSNFCDQKSQNVFQLQVQNYSTHSMASFICKIDGPLATY